MSPQKVFITGATGFIGRVVTELAVKEGYTVRGLSRRDEGDELLESLGATPVRGDLTNNALLTEESKNADIVLHLAFDHDFSKPYEQLINLEFASVSALAKGLEGTGKPLVVTNATSSAAPDPQGGETDEETPAGPVSFGNRDVAEKHALSFVEKGVRVVSIRLPQYVYGRGNTNGFAAQLIKLAIASGEAAYIGDGEYCFSDVYVDDAAQLYLNAVKHAEAGDVFNGTGHTTTTYKAMAGAISQLLDVPARSIIPEDAVSRWGPFLTAFFTIRNRSSNKKAIDKLGWKPVGPGLLWEVHTGSYVAVADKFKADAAASD